MSLIPCSFGARIADDCRPTTNAPKANTRFLRNIIKETDSHNAALRLKEAQDAKARSRRLHHDGLESPKLGKRRRDEGDHLSERQRIDRTNDEAAVLGRRSEKPSSRRRDNDNEIEYRRSHRRRKYHDTSDDDSDRHSHHDRHKHHHRNPRRRSRDISGEQDLKLFQGPNSKKEDQIRSPRVNSDHRHNRRRRWRRSSSSSSKNKYESRMEDSRASKSHHSSKPSNENPPLGQPPSSLESQDSDPLDSIIGPPPPPPVPKILARGRGTFASSTTIDAHFSSHYDPAADVRPDPDTEDDWDQALEALRDRQRWKQQGADRLRAAGFTEEEVGKWETGGENREEDVRWRGKGEGREWDRGKVVGEEGVETMPEWGRLKGT